MNLIRYALLALTLGVSLFGQSTLAIVEKKAGKVGFYTEEGRRIGEVQVGRYPHEIAFSPDRRFFYVTDNGMLWMTDPGAGGNSISIIEAIDRIEHLTGRKIAYIYHEQNRKGDHICYISDLAKFKSHYPGWTVTRSLDAMLEEMIEAQSPRITQYA